VENLAQRLPGIVATVGLVEATPGAMNVIAGEAPPPRWIFVTLRIVREPKRWMSLIRQAESSGAKRGVTVKWRTLLGNTRWRWIRFLTEQIAQAIQKAGCEPQSHGERGGA